MNKVKRQIADAVVRRAGLCIAACKGVPVGRLTPGALAAAEADADRLARACLSSEAEIDAALTAHRERVAK